MDYCHTPFRVSRSAEQRVRFIKNLPSRGRLSVVFVYTSIGPDHQLHTNRIGAYADENPIEFIFPTGSFNREIHYYGGRVLHVVPGQDVYYASQGR